MDIAAICPRKEWLTEFKQCWPDIEKLAQWHIKYTPWIDKQTLEQFLNGYKQQIQRGQSTQNMMQEEEEEKEISQYKTKN